MGVRVKFLESRAVKDHRAGTPDETRFKAGETYDLPESSANHWINRGVAEVYVEPELPLEEKADQPETSASQGKADQPETSASQGKADQPESKAKQK